jgi:hypothetical protein
MYRRAFCTAVLGLVSTIVFSSQNWFGSHGTARAAASLADLELARRLTDLLRTRPRVALLGKIILWQRPSSSIAELVDGVLPGGLKTQHRRSEKWLLRRTVRARIGADYAALRMENVGGWLLSLTEARIAALAAIEQQPPG